MSGAPLLLSHPACLDHDAGPGHPERPARLTAVQERLASLGWLGYERRAAPLAPEAAVAAVHPPPYLDGLRALEARGGGFLDAGETVVRPGSVEAALRAAGAACALAEELLAGRAPTGFCAVRPPGHHAHAERTSGFCLLNSVAIAARHALDALGARRVAIVDWDVHHGDGTNAIFRASDRVLYASIHQQGIFPGTGALLDVGARTGEGFSINLPVPPGAGEAEWLSLLEWIVVPAVVEFGPDLILVSAGFDAHRDDPLASCLLEGESFAEMARHVRDAGARAGAPVGAVLEGGYALEALADSVARTMAALAGDRPPGSVAPDFATSRAASQLGHYWTLSP